MAIVVVHNSKGGVGKSTISAELAVLLGAKLVDCDPKGNQEFKLAGQKDKGFEITEIIKIGLNDSIPFFDNQNAVYDLGGYDDSRYDDLFAIADIILVPTKDTDGNAPATINSYEYVKQFNHKIKIIINAYKKEQEAKDYKDRVKSVLTNDDEDYFYIPDTAGFRSAEKEGCAVVQLASVDNFKKRIYANITTPLNQLANIICEGV